MAKEEALLLDQADAAQIKSNKAKGLGKYYAEVPVRKVYGPKLRAIEGEGYVCTNHEREHTRRGARCARCYAKLDE